MTLKYSGPFLPWDVRKVIDSWRHPQSDLVSICAHRGASHEGGVENSLTSFRRAAQEGWESVEIDVRLTRDGQVVVFHDRGLGRLTDITVPDGEVLYNPFTGKGYNPPLNSFDWEDIKILHLRDGYGRVSAERPILLHELLDHLREQKISMVVQVDLKEPEVVESALGVIYEHADSNGIPAYEWCIFKPRSDWFPSPEVWENQKAIQTTFKAGLPSPPVTPLYEVDEGHSIANMEAWAEKDYFVGYEIALKYVGGTFQESVDFVKSAKSKCKGHGGWYIGSDLPTGYFEGQRTVWDDSSVRDAILAKGPTMPCQMVEDVGARQPGSVPFDSDTDVVDQRTRLAYVLSVGNNYFIADTHTDVHSELHRLGLRNTSRMLRTL